MSFTPRLNSNNMIGNPWWYSLGNVFWASGFGLPNCTCYCYGRFAEIRGSFATLPTGNAGEWFDDATDFIRGGVPKLGSVICYKSQSGRYAGHVAIVEVINTDGSIITSNSAYNGRYFWAETVKPENGYLSPWMTSSRDYYCLGFIYNDAVYDRNASIYVIAAMCGCWKRESTLNPAIWESLTPVPWDYQYEYTGIGGFGLGQWTNVGTPNGRLWHLHEWVIANGYNDGDGDGQLAYILQEDYWLNSPQTRGNYTTLSEFLSTDSTSLPDLVWDFLANWEGVPGDAFSERLEAAGLFLNYLNVFNGDDPSLYDWIESNSYLSWEDMYCNLMMIYFWFTNGKPKPIPTKKRKGLPLWMLLRYR